MLASLILNARATKLRVAGGVEACDQDDAVAVQTVEEAEGKALDEDAARLGERRGRRRG
jgi:hypothetical protein